jgi:hypothetical protein
MDACGNYRERTARDRELPFRLLPDDLPKRQGCKPKSEYATTCDAQG